MNIRHLNFKYVSNMRDIGGYLTKDNHITKFNRIIRSNYIKKLEDDEFNYLKEQGLSLNIDLRQDEDTNIKVSYLRDKVNYINISMHDDIPKEERNIPSSYMNILENKNIKIIFDLIKDNDGLIIINCSMGKDRTGVIIMLLLLLCGVNNKDIIADYALSYSYLKDDVNLYHLNHPEAPGWLGASKSWYMEETIKLFFKKYSSLKEYFVDYLGLSYDDLFKIRESLIEDGKE